MSAAESIKSHLGNLFGSEKTQSALRLSVTVLLLFLLARTGADLTWQLGASFLSSSRAIAPGQLTGQSSPASSGASQTRATPPVEEIALFGQTAGALPPPGGGG